MKKKKSFGRFAACALCAGILCGGTGCRKESQQTGQQPTPPPTQQAVPVTIQYSQEGRVIFADAKGAAETVLPLPQGSKCTGSAEGKTTYRQGECSFQPVKAKIGGDEVTIYWTSPSGSARRSDNSLTLTQNLAVRVVKSGPDGYDCSSSGTQEFTATARVNTGGSEKVTLRPVQEGAKVRFEPSRTCLDTAGTSLAETLAFIRQLEEIINVACW